MATRNLCKIKRPLGTPCPASCNPCSAKVQLENDLKRVTIQIRETETNYTAKLTECAALRAEVLEKMDEISSNRQQLAEVMDRVRQLEMKLEGFSQKAGVLKFQEQLQQLEPLPDLLRATEARLKVAYQKQAEAEHNTESLARQVNCVRNKLVKLSEKPPPEQIKINDDEERMNSLIQRVQQATDAKNVLETEIRRLKAESDRVAEAIVLSDSRVVEKEAEVNALADKLKRAGARATRSVKNAERRVDVLRECFKSKIAQLERQLVEVRARLTAAEKERDELQRRLQGQVVQLSLSLQQANQRISGLEAQVLRLQPISASAKRKCTCTA